MRVKSIKKSYTIASSLLLSMFICILLYNYLSQVRIFWQSAVEQIAINAIRHAGVVDTWFTEKMVVVDVVARDLVYFGLTENVELESYLTNISATNAGVMAAYFAADDKRIIFSDGNEAPPGFDPTIRVWYVHAKANSGKTVASEPYIDILTGTLVVTFCRVVRLANGIEGVVGIDYGLSTITNFVDSVRPYHTGRSFLLSSANNIVTHANVALLPKLTDDASGSAVFTKYSEVRTTDVNHVKSAYDNVTIKRLTLRGVKKYVAQTRINNVGWYYGCEIPVSDFNGDLFKITLPLIAMTLIGLLIFGSSIAVSHAHINQIKKMAYTDMLTGILNRRQFLALATAQVERVKRSGSNSYIVIFDLDHFKKINDTYGHAAGDSVLKSTVERVRHTIRPYDFFGRYGGEEFIIFISDISEENALKHAERIRTAICEQPVKIAAAQHLTVTASFGMARVTAYGSIDEVISHADKALYRAKQNGRNRVEMFEMV